MIIDGPLDNWVSQVTYGGDSLQMWIVAGNILNKEQRTADKGRTSSLDVGPGANILNKE